MTHPQRRFAQACLPVTVGEFVALAALVMIFGNESPIVHTGSTVLVAIAVAVGTAVFGLLGRPIQTSQGVSITIAITEAAAVLGALCLPIAWSSIAVFLGASVTFLVKRVGAAKLVLFSGLRAVTAAMWCAVFALWPSMGTFSWPSLLGVLFGALLTESVFISLMVVVLWRMHGRVDRPPALSIGIGTSMINSSIVLALVDVYQHRPSLFVLLCPLLLGLVLLIRAVAKLLSERHQWASFGSLIDALDQPEISSCDLVALFRECIAVETFEWTRRGRDGEISRIIATADSVEKSTVPSEHWATQSTQPHNHIVRTSVPPGVSCTQHTARGLNVWAARGYPNGIKGGDLYESIDNKILSVMCLMVASSVEAREDLDDAQFRANHDALTGLLNRSGFAEAAGDLLTQSGPVVVAQIDLDRFKIVNDTWGHPVGDDFLVHIADGLRRVLPAETLLGRPAGDEFAFAVHLADCGSPETLMTRVLGAMESPFSVNDTTSHYGSGSIGYTISSSEFATLGELVKRADKALYVAKAARSGVCRWHAGMKAEGEFTQVDRRLVSAFSGIGSSQSPPTWAQLDHSASDRPGR